MSDTSNLNQCPKCGGPIPPEAPQGLCPKCLLAEASIPTDTADASPRPTPPALSAVAAAFPQLEIVELIGQGGMGFVYKARQPKLERFVALKILPQPSVTDPRFAERFTREGRILARLSHPNIVAVHDFGQANGFFYLLMEYVDGVNQPRPPCRAWCRTISSLIARMRCSSNTRTGLKSIRDCFFRAFSAIQPAACICAMRCCCRG